MFTRALRGFSLVEVLVATALLAILASVMTSLVVVQLRIGQRAQRKFASDRAHMLLLESLRQDIISTTSNGLSLRADGLALAVQPVRDVSSEGLLFYRKDRLIAYTYDATAKQMLRRLWQDSLPLELTSPPGRLVGAQWDALSTRPPLRRGSWDGLDEFRVRTETGDSQQLSARLWFDCRWLHGDRKWQTSYCLATRQLP